MASKLPNNIPQDERFLFDILRPNFYHKNWKTATTLQEAGIIALCFTLTLYELRILG